MGNPLPNYSAGRVPTFRITTRDADKAVDFASMWGGDNGIWKHMTLEDVCHYILQWNKRY